jgi:hypothetical protein
LLAYCLFQRKYAIGDKLETVKDTLQARHHSEVAARAFLGAGSRFCMCLEIFHFHEWRTAPLSNRAFFQSYNKAILGKREMNLYTLLNFLGHRFPFGEQSNWRYERWLEVKKKGIGCLL